MKVNDGKIEVIPFVVKPSSKLSIVDVEIIEKSNDFFLSPNLNAMSWTPFQVQLSS